MQNILGISEKPAKKFWNNINKQPGKNAVTNFIDGDSSDETDRDTKDVTASEKHVSITNQMHFIKLCFTEKFVCLYETEKFLKEKHLNHTAIHCCGKQKIKESIPIGLSLQVAV